MKQQAACTAVDDRPMSVAPTAWLARQLQILALLLGSMLSVPTLALELNNASEAELDSLRGIGPPTTRRILAAREQGRFANWGDFLRRVKGLGPHHAQRLSAQGLTVDGQPFAAATPAQPADGPATAAELPRAPDDQ